MTNGAIMVSGTIGSRSIPRRYVYIVEDPAPFTTGALRAAAIAKGIQVDGGSGCVAPSTETVQDGSYTPLSRPLFIYPSDQALARPEVKAFTEFYVTNYQKIAEEALFVPLTEEQAAQAKQKVAQLAGS